MLCGRCKMSNKKPGKTVFVGNIPYGLSEEQIREVLGRVGTLDSFRLVTDPETGRPKGFGFATYFEEDAAASAVRNLNDYQIEGRSLRVDYSNDSGGGADKKPHQKQLQDQLDAQGPPPSTTLPPLPAGSEVPPHLTAPDAISETLKTLPPVQLLDVLSQMKGLVMNDPARATELLRQAPQLSYAIFQALLLLNLVTPDTLHTIIEQTVNAGGASTQVAPPVQPPMPPQQQTYPGYPPHLQAQQQYGNPTPPMPPQQYPPSHSMPPQQPPPQAMPQAQPDQQQLINAVLQMSQEQLNQLDPASRAQIMALRAQYGAR